MHALKLSLEQLPRVLGSLELLIRKHIHLLSHCQYLIRNIYKLLVQYLMQTTLNRFLYHIAYLVCYKITLHHLLAAIVSQYPGIHHFIFNLLLKYELAFLLSFLFRN